jgi:Tol biopolymer transport system component
VKTGRIRSALVAAFVSLVAPTARVAAATPYSFIAITDTSNCSNDNPSINPSGQLITFSSTCDLTPGSPGNADGNDEIFLYNTSTRTFTQITNTTSCTNVDPTINGAGTVISFESDCDLTGGNADGNFEIFDFSVSGSTFSQITDTKSCDNTDPWINPDGSTIVFVSTCDLTPGSPGNADGNTEIFEFNSPSTFVQITDTSVCSNGNPAIDAAGSVITFDSFCDIVPPGNADGSNEIFAFDTAGSTFRQVTNNTGCDNADPASNPTGTLVPIQSDCNLVPGGNADGNDEIFLLDARTHTFSQVTSTTGCGNVDPYINAFATKVSFQSDCNLTGSNADGNDEIVLAVAAPAPAPALSSLGLLAMAVLLALFGVWSSSRIRRSPEP